VNGAIEQPAIVGGVALAQLPKDLYIPPDALKIFLEAFEGPLDLLLYLIQRQNLDILNIPIAEITRQYVQYIELMQELQLDLAAEYLLMAATLMEIKSRFLLPTPKATPIDSDPRAKLVQQLQEYARYKAMAEKLAELPQVGQDIFPVTVVKPEMNREIIIPPLSLTTLLAAMQDVIMRTAFLSAHQVRQEPLSVRERMSLILERLQQATTIPFIDLLTIKEGRAGVVVSFLAILELAKEALIQIIQPYPLAPIEVSVLNHHD